MDEEHKMAERQNEVLIRELYREMEVELEKEPEKMDTEKIRHLNFLLDRLEGRGEFPDNLEKEKFFKEFDEKYGFDFNKSNDASKRTVIYSRKWKPAAAVIVIIVTVIVANTVSVAAIDKSLWQLLKETRYDCYFTTKGTESITDVPMEEIVDLQAQEEEFGTWEELVDHVEVPLLNLEYMPEGMEAVKISKTDFDDLVTFFGRFIHEDLYVQISCEYAKITGNVVKPKDENGIEAKKVGERLVRFSEGTENKALFEEAGVLYTIETNLEKEELTKIIENLNR